MLVSTVCLDALLASSPLCTLCRECRLQIARCSSAVNDNRMHQQRPCKGDGIEHAVPR